MRILIIEDEKDVADLVRRALLEESHVMDSAEDGRQREALALAEAYDLCLAGAGSMILNLQFAFCLKLSILNALPFSFHLLCRCIV